MTETLRDRQTGRWEPGSLIKVSHPPMPVLRSESRWHRLRAVALESQAREQARLPQRWLTATRPDLTTPPNFSGAKICADSTKGPSDEIQTHKRLKRTLIKNCKTHHANFRGKSLFPTTKQHKRQFKIDSSKHWTPKDLGPRDHCTAVTTVSIAVTSVAYNHRQRK